MRDGRIGYIDTPAQGNVRPAGVAWAADNGAFGSGYPGDEGFLAWLAANDPAGCIFATAPDVIGDHQRTWVRSGRFTHRIRDLGYPVAYVAQNGARPHSIPWKDVDALFIGGLQLEPCLYDWKLGPEARDVVSEAKCRSKWVHMGRVNSGKRLRYAEAIGCDSADGTCLTYGADINLPQVLGWVDQVNHQLVLS